MSQWKEVHQKQMNSPEVGEDLAYLRPMGLEHDKSGGNWGSQQDPDHVTDLLKGF